MSASAPPRPRAAAPTRGLSPGFVRLLPLALTLLIAIYMLFIGGTFDATVRYQVQLLNTVGAGLLGLAWLAGRARGPGLALTGLEWPLAALALSQWVALAASAQPRLGLEWAALVTFWCLALLVLSDVLRAGWPRAFVLQALVLLAALVTLMGLAEVAAWYAGWLAAGQWPPFTFRLNGWLGHANLTAAFINLLLPLVLVQAGRAGALGTRVALGGLAAGMVVVLFFTSSRAGWLAGAAGLACLAGLAVLGSHGRASLAWLRGRWAAIPRRSRGLLMLGALAALLLGTRLLAAQTDHITHGPLFASRETFWNVAWHSFRLQPLTGAGPDLFPWLYTRWVPAPPYWFAPHAHSLLFQVLSGSGLLGLLALLALLGAAGWQLARRWWLARDRLLVAGLLAGLAAFDFQHLFDYLLGSNVAVLVVVALLALALTEGTPPPPGRSLAAVALAPVMLVPLAVAVFALRGASLNDRGLALANEGDWPAAADAFEQAARLDPRLTLYWQHAAYARTRAGDPAAALPLWQRAAQDDRYWQWHPATVAVLNWDRAALAAADGVHNGSSHLLALNLGVLAEAAGDEAAARADYARALALRPSSAAALFWQQTPVRRSALDDWLETQSAESTALRLGQAALAAAEFDLAVRHFQQALAEDPGQHAAYAGLAAAYLALGERSQTEAVLAAGQRAPMTAPEQVLDLHLIAGDLARANGNDAAAAEAYALVFSAINDYTVYGPGTYGHPQRAWYVYRRHSLPVDLVPQFARADITAAMDERFAWLAAWTVSEGQAATDCYIAARVWGEAPQSASGAYWEENCR